MNKNLDSNSVQIKIKKYSRLLDQYADEIFARYFKGESMANISDWLSKPPRLVPNRREGLYRWIKSRTKKIEIRSKELSEPILEMLSCSTALQLNTENSVSAISSKDSGGSIESIQVSVAENKVNTSKDVSSSNPNLYEPWLKDKPPKVDLSELIRQSKEQKWPMS